MNRGTREFEVRRERLLPFPVVAALILFRIVSNWMCLTTNVTSMGRDLMGHLIGARRPKGGPIEKHRSGK